MATVGYLEGTDPGMLTKLAIEGMGTLPLSNGFDQHGKYVNHLTGKNGVSVVVGYLHKVLPTADIPFGPEDILFACRTHRIPVRLIAEKSLHEKARRLLGGMADFVQLVGPEEVYEAILQVVS